MTSEQLVKLSRFFCSHCGASDRLTQLCSDRLLGIGFEQYDHGDRQAFEDYTMEKMISMFDEEVADVVSYTLMLLLRPELGGELGPELVDFAQTWISAYSPLREHLEEVLP